MIQKRKESEEHRLVMVDALVARGLICSPAIREAFLTVPREAFIPFFYQEGECGWKLRFPMDIPEKEWLSAIYRDEPLIIKISDRHMPLSSSSMPSVMARMLEALQVELGQQVLEIGTGTGYNAALLATLAGNPACVTTIEIDEHIAMRARDALQQIVGKVRVQIGDGQEGVIAGKPALFDRIIATASCRTFPWAWYKQLAPGGRLVMDLRGGLNISSFCILEKALDGTGARGAFQTPPLYFMPIQEATKQASPLAPSSQATWTLSTDDSLPARLQSKAFRWFLQWRHPGLSGSQGTITRADTKEPLMFVRLRDQRGTCLDLEQGSGQGPWRVQCIGSTELWNILLRASVEWDNLGQPDQQAYHLEIAHDQAVLRVAGAHLPL